MKAINLKRKFVERVRSVKLPNGKLVKIHEIVHNGSVVIIPIKDNKIILERHYRPVIGKWVYELPAGTIEKGEAPEKCARRELVEETGYVAKKIKKIFVSYPSPGYSTELQHFFLATNLEKSEKHLMVDEVINLKEVTAEEAVEMIKKKKIIDGKTIQAILFYVFLLREK
jgi:ADP-ribose pyrophosphatase